MSEQLRDQLQASLGTAYTIQREIGGGGMSRIYLAHDESLGRDIVIKLLPPELAAEMSAERFTREIKLAAALQNPHVLPVLSAGVTNNLPYYTMPFVRGESLRNAIEKKSLSIEDSIEILRDIARALRYAHGEGVVHRDIKPENILLSSGSAVVVDFGIAKALSASRTPAPGGTLTLVGTSIGTPAYMSPEQAAADPNIDHRADIYAWGVVAYELLNGKHPFDGKTTPQQYLAAHLSESPPSLKRIGSRVPPEIADIVMRALEKDPTRRPQSADELLAYLGGKGSGPVAAAAMKRRVWRLEIIASAAVAVIALGIALWQVRGKSAADSAIMLAVLPFENHGPADQEYFVDGLTDAVNGKLAGLPGVSVIDRRSSLVYKKSTKPVKQIGSELGVQYVLAGVVRWADGPSGRRAQVMPTLINTSNATTKWAGEPVIVSSSDPFSAQTEIATKVAGALQLALGSEEMRDLAERPTQNVDAYDAFQRGKATLERATRATISIREIDLAIAQLKQSVALDPTFADAWAYLSAALNTRSSNATGDTSVIAQAIAAANRSWQLAPNNPFSVIARSGALFSEGNKPEGVRVIADAVKKGIANPDLLYIWAWDLMDAGKKDSANAAMARAVKLNPRYPQTLLEAAAMAAEQKNFALAEQHSRALISIDPTDERGWANLSQYARNKGDTAQSRKVLEEAMRNIPSPTNRLLVQMVYSGRSQGLRFIRMSPEDLRIETLRDSIRTYYDNKSDFFLREGNLAMAKIYHDSIIAKLRNRDLTGRSENDLRNFLAFAYAATGRLAEAKIELQRAEQAALKWKQFEDDGKTPRMDGRIVAAVLSLEGKDAEAVARLRRQIARSSWTPRGVYLEPKLRFLRGKPEFEALAREN